MKSLAQQLTEKVATLRARGKGEAVDAILAETSEYTIEAQLGKLNEFSRSLTPSVTKHNGASDNANHQESFNESSGADDTTSRAALVNAAMAAFGFTEAEASFFASDKPVNAEVDALTKAVLGGK